MTTFRQPPPPTASETGIALRELTKTFSSPQGPVPAVRGVSLDIAAGETVALLGPNGAGKSTTIDMMLGLLQPDGGEVSIFGHSPAQAVRAGLIGAMLQTGGLVQYLTVRELVTMMASLYPHPLAVQDVLELTGVADIAGQRTNKLSGGQTQRVRAAIALVANADLLVLDEPTVAMDVEGRHQFWTFMRDVAASGKTVVFATHYLEEADAYADRIVLMARGRIVADGPTTEIKATVGLRTIRATLPRLSRNGPTGSDERDLDGLRRLAGVTAADRRGDAITLRCEDSDAAIRALLAAHDDVHDIEIAGAGLEEAFLALTGDDPPAAGAGAATATHAEMERSSR